MNREKIIRKVMTNLKYAGYPAEFEKGFKEGLVYLVDQSEEYNGQDSKDFTKELNQKITKDLKKFHMNLLSGLRNVDDVDEDDYPKFDDDFGSDLASAVGIGRSGKLDSYSGENEEVLDLINDILEKFPTYTITLNDEGKIDLD